MTETDQPARVLVAADRPVAVLTLNRPQARNAIDQRTGRALDAALTALEADRAVRVIVIAASGPAFCAGADLKALAAGEPEAFIDDRGWAGVTRRRGPVPLIAAVEGPALAGGLELVLACDLAVCSTDASFGLPEARHGLLAAAGGAVSLPGVAGSKAALELLLTGDPVDAHRALDLGMVNRVVAPGEAECVARELGARIARNGAEAVDAARRVVADVQEHGPESAHRLAATLLVELLEGRHARERLDAFARREHGTDLPLRRPESEGPPGAAAPPR